MIASHGVESIYIYLYACVTYVTMHCIRSKEVTLFQGLGHLMGVAHYGTYTRPTGRKKLIAYIETGNMSCSTCLVPRLSQMHG